MENVVTVKLLPHELDDVARMMNKTVEEITGGVILDALIDFDTSDALHQLYGVEVKYNNTSTLNKYILRGDIY